MTPLQAPAQETGQQNTRRTPLKSAVLLMPLWGEAYIRQFLEIGFPSLMAPGNIPAIAKKIPFYFEFLTSADDERIIRSHPAFAKLCSVATVSFRSIDHLIKARNYATTLTLAYAEAVRARGAEMLDTCFFFLVCDYVLADGALSNVFARIESGFSGVQAGNFQITDRKARAWLRSKLSPDNSCLSVSARELMRFGLEHIHPITAASIINNPLAHTTHANKLFWRVDRNTLLGRFFLMHMIAIRPELIDFEIGSSCDYSFVPEMCPSGNVTVMTDSDDYMIVELQTLTHESSFIKPGKLSLPKMAKTLNEWTTPLHRKNCEHSLVFHAEDVPGTIFETIEEANRFLDQVKKRLTKSPQPHRGHPYWRGAMAAFRESCGLKLANDDKFWLQGLHSKRSLAISKARFALFGYPPRVYPWHQRWLDYRTVLKFLDPVIDESKLKILSVAEKPTPYTVLIANGKAESDRIETSMLTKLGPVRKMAMEKRFDFCMLELDENELKKVGAILDCITLMMKPGGKILLTVNCTRPIATVVEDIIHGKTGAFRFTSAWVKQAGCVPSGYWRQEILRVWEKLGRLAIGSSTFALAALLVACFPLSVLTLLNNIFIAANKNTGMSCSTATSIYFLLEVSP